MVTPVVESDGGIACPNCQDHFLEQTGSGSLSLGDRLPVWSTGLLGLVGRAFGSTDDELEGRSNGMPLGLVRFSFGGGRESGARSDSMDFALTLADYILEGEKRVRTGRLRRPRLNRTRVRESGSQCCICLEDFELGEEAEETLCKHRFHGFCIDSWLKKGSGTCPMCRSSISDARESKTKRLTFTNGRGRNSLGLGRRARSSIRGFRNYFVRRWPI
ncbi:hypothetical protein MLD38_030929 [Melastoma candidum]|uniref:Uncharacterized protein n=1 Tax=Melastoma candidum TaxID=119954 RepID=A0ACB9MN74_9MYRT|nr:hypothetical protein MLD38_030929 [Melastoma candidum]